MSAGSVLSIDCITYTAKECSDFLKVLGPKEFVPMTLTKKVSRHKSQKL
jgi:hypothetical protein